MPPKNVKTIRELIYWEYAKLIAGSAVGDRKNYAFIMHEYKGLCSGHLHPSSLLRDNKAFVEAKKVCLYCDCAHQTLQWEHIIPLSRGGPDTIDNMVLACGECNQKKGTKDLFEWYGEERRYEIPRLALGKYLKLVFERAEGMGTLDSGDLNADGKLDVYDLGAVFKKA